MSVSIFVSHRTDMRAELIENGIFHNMLCGAAAYDGERYIDGDDTLDNISLQKPNLSELTVQYWAWKNCSSDYIGLCHYRRFLSFNTGKHFYHNRRNYVESVFLNERTQKKYRLNSPEAITSVVEACDGAVNIPFDVRRIISPMGRVNNVYELWHAHTILFLDKRAFELLPEIVKEVEPEYFSSLNEYFSGTSQRGYNCYVLKKELFSEMCRFQFSIISALNSRISPDSYDEKYKRTPGYIAEILYGVYIHHIMKKGYKLKELQLVFFSHAEVQKKTAGGFFRRILYCAASLDRFILPVGTRRRHFCKRAYVKLLSIIKRSR